MERTALLYRIILILVLSWTTGTAQPLREAESADSVSSLSADSIGKRDGLLHRIVRYFSEANVPREEGKFDVSFIGGPYYSSDIGLGIGVVASGQYGFAIGDSVSDRLLHSEAGVFLNVSTTGFVKFGVEGIHFFPDDRQRLSYELSFENFPKKFWGIGFHNGKQNTLWSKYDEVSLRLHSTLGCRLGGNFFLGPSLDIAWINAIKVEKTVLWDGEKLRMAVLGLGAVMSYDTRDNITAPRHGNYMSAEARLYPSFLGNGDRHCMVVDMALNHYMRLWKSGIMAFRLHGALSWGETPWCLLPTFGGSRDMRGYYEGRYRDKNQVSATIELRQKIWHRCGAVVWAGAGTVFKNARDLSWHHILPNFGIGYRWEFKRNSNVRIDFGIGRSETGFIFNINEAF